MNLKLTLFYKSTSPNPHIVKVLLSIHATGPVEICTSFLICGQSANNLSDNNQESEVRAAKYQKRKEEQAHQVRCIGLLDCSLNLLLVHSIQLRNLFLNTIFEQSFCCLGITISLTNKNTSLKRKI
jgi:hypothetical protein